MTSCDNEADCAAAGVGCQGEGGPAVFSHEVPFFFSIATNLARVLHLSREEQLGIWKRVVALYAERGKPLPAFLSNLCQPPFVEGLLEDEVFWGMAGPAVGRLLYAEATQYLPAVYATAALMAAGQDRLPINCGDQTLLASFNAWRHER
jgi:hypothetical protein